MAVAADDARAGESKALLGPDDVHNALSLVAEAKVGEAKLFDITFQGFALCPAVGFVDEGGDVLEVLARGGRNVLQRRSRRLRRSSGR